eukprot:1652574-Rhodomonas_salina.1
MVTTYNRASTSCTMILRVEQHNAAVPQSLLSTRALRTVQIAGVGAYQERRSGGHRRVASSGEREGLK